MQHRNWVERFERELILQGVPARARRRLVAELSDHAEDLADREGLTMTETLLEQRLGEPAILASQAAAQTRGATWVSRHPALVFALFPIPLILLAMVMLVLAMGLPFEGLRSLLGVEMPRSLTVAWVYSALWVIRYGSFMLVALFYARMFTRHHVRRWWFALAAVQVLLFAGCFISQIQFSDLPGQSQLTLGLAYLPIPNEDGWRIPYLPGPGVAQVFQVLLPLAVGGYVIWHARKREAILAGA